MTPRQAFANYFSGNHGIRSIKSTEKEIYLTFDDGPDPETTPEVLKILDKHNAKANFFMIADKAEQYPELALEVAQKGHSIGNHSLDHKYSHFFKGHLAIENWIESADQKIQKITGQNTIGFRPPVGIITPHVLLAAHRLEKPIILWNVRFYDAIKKWTEEKAKKSLDQIKSGDVILLHDRQKTKNRTEFLKTLDFYLMNLRRKGWNTKIFPSPGTPPTMYRQR